MSEKKRKPEEGAEVGMGNVTTSVTFENRARPGAKQFACLYLRSPETPFCDILAFQICAFRSFFIHKHHTNTFEVVPNLIGPLVVCHLSRFIALFDELLNFFVRWCIGRSLSPRNVIVGRTPHVVRARAGPISRNFKLWRWRWKAIFLAVSYKISVNLFHLQFCVLHRLFQYSLVLARDAQ